MSVLYYYKGWCPIAIDEEYAKEIEKKDLEFFKHQQRYTDISVMKRGTTAILENLLKLCEKHSHGTKRTNEQIYESVANEMRLPVEVIYRMWISSVSEGLRLGLFENDDMNGTLRLPTGLCKLL